MVSSSSRTSAAVNETENKSGFASQGLTSLLLECISRVAFCIEDMMTA